MVTDVKIQTSTTSIQPMSRRVFILALILNTVGAAISYGYLPSVCTYVLLPFGQKAFYYWTVSNPLSYPLSLVLTLYWKSVSNLTIVILSLINWLLSAFILLIAAQSPCPWLADTTQGAVMIISIWFMASFLGGFLRITIGNRIKREWKDDKGMVYFGGTTQLGSLLGTVPIYILINIFEVFNDRKPCQTYCLV